ncbi:MAG: hypothetical protein M3R24_23015 [Chloroflexota bacterium]|nr:hypothetical protein [Chloroflexota bacterium]
MPRIPARTPRRTLAAVIGSLTLGLFVGVALLGWIAGWQTIPQYSAALCIAGVISILIGASATHDRSGPSHDGVAASELARLCSRGQPDYYADQQRSFTGQLVMTVVGLLVGGSGLLLQLLVG